MRDDYRLNGPTKKIKVELEKDVAAKLEKMVQFTDLSTDEITNTALKRFIANHKDFLPREEDEEIGSGSSGKQAG